MLVRFFSIILRITMARMKMAHEQQHLSAPVKLENIATDDIIPSKQHWRPIRHHKPAMKTHIYLIGDGMRSVAVYRSRRVCQYVGAGELLRNKIFDQRPDICLMPANLS